MSERQRPYSRKEAAEYLGVSVDTLDRCIRGGELAVTRPSPRRVVLLESVLRRYRDRKTKARRSGK